MSHKPHRKYLVLIVVSFVLVLQAINHTAISVAFPVIITDFDISLVLAGWVLNSFQLMAIMVMPLAGKLSEAIGTKSAFMVYLFLFMLGSALCGLAPNIGLLIAFRVIQAIGAGGIQPIAAAIVSDEFPAERQRYLGLFGSIGSFGILLGPNLGGWIVQVFGWRWVFGFNVPLTLAVILVLWFILSAGEKQRKGTGIDFVGVGLLFGFLSAFLLGITQLGSSGSGPPWISSGPLFILSVILLFFFIRRKKGTAEPVLDLQLLKQRPFLAANAFNLLFGFCALGLFNLLPLYAVSIYKMSILESGVFLTPRSAGMMVSSAIVSFFLLRWGYRRPILIGTVGTLVGLVLLALQPKEIDILGLHLGATLVFAVMVAFCGITQGICNPATNNACIELMPGKVAAITGLRLMFRQLGATIGVAVATVVLHNIGDMQQAFFVILAASALVMLLSLPLVFMMPSSPNTRASAEALVKVESG